jgi:hypothetical protein
MSRELFRPRRSRRCRSDPERVAIGAGAGVFIAIVAIAAIVSTGAAA